MSDSATIHNPGTGLRERKRVATRAAITDTARSLVAKHGFAGFTIEQLCAQVGISRRTFFNYFPSKEDALIGRQEDGFPDNLVEEFVQAGQRPGPEAAVAGLSPRLIDDLVELACRTAEQTALTRDEYGQLMTAIAKDPALLAKLIGSSGTREREFTELIAARERIDPDDPRAVMATVVFTAVTRRTGQEYFSQHNNRSYRQILTGYVAALKELFH